MLQRGGHVARAERYSTLWDDAAAAKLVAQRQRADDAQRGNIVNNNTKTKDKEEREKKKREREREGVDHEGGRGRGECGALRTVDDGNYQSPRGP